MADVAGHDGGRDRLLDVRQEAAAIDQTINDAGASRRSPAQGGQKGGML
jgi:hypothetical protein